MSDEASPPWPSLTLVQRRVLGVLIEKQKTTPDVYPMSLNAVVTGSNQKSNREPVLNLTDVDAEDNLDQLQKLALVTRVDSGRVEKWRHLLYEQWHVGKGEISVLAELLLRGPQTEGDLRGRVSRMEPVADLDALRVLLRPLVQRGLVKYLTPEGRRGTVLTHGFHDPAEWEHLQLRHAGAAEADDHPLAAAPSRAAAPDLSGRLAALETNHANLDRQVQELQTALARLADQLEALRTALGVQS